MVSGSTLVSTNASSQHVPKTCMGRVEFDKVLSWLDGWLRSHRAHLARGARLQIRASLLSLFLQMSKTKIGLINCKVSEGDARKGW